MGGGSRHPVIPSGSAHAFCSAKINRLSKFGSAPRMLTFILNFWLVAQDEIVLFFSYGSHFYGSPGGTFITYYLSLITYFLLLITH